MKETGRVIKVSGPLIVAGGMADSKMYDVVRVGEQRLIGEIIELRGDKASIQVYEETQGIGPGTLYTQRGSAFGGAGAGAYRKHIRRHTAAAHHTS